MDGEECANNVVEVKRVSDRVTSETLEIEGVMIDLVNLYAPNVGCETEEKRNSGVSWIKC